MNIVVIGDTILDKYHTSELSISKENNITYKISNTNILLGGALNVSENLNNLKCNIEVISVIGDDNNGKIVTELLNKKSIRNKLFIDSQRKTTEKNKIIYDNKIIFNYDIEDVNDINYELENNIYRYLTSLKNISIIVFSDYNRGVLTINLCKRIIKYANNFDIKTFVDTKSNDYFKYKNCFLIKPNYNEGKNISKKTRSIYPWL
jgi:D-beta-D-heptose 7-phosphate kinase/D-beta-D-heptose 1-phosphate adenosyltransferase